MAAQSSRATTTSAGATMTIPDLPTRSPIVPDSTATPTLAAAISYPTAQGANPAPNRLRREEHFKRKHEPVGEARCDETDDAEPGCRGDPQQQEAGHGSDRGHGEHTVRLDAIPEDPECGPPGGHAPPIRCNSHTGHSRAESAAFGQQAVRPCAGAGGHPGVEEEDRQREGKNEAVVPH